MSVSVNFSKSNIGTSFCYFKVTLKIPLSLIHGTIIPSLVAQEVYHWTQNMESSWMLGCSIHQHRSREVKPDSAQHCSALWPGWHCIVVKWLLHCTHSDALVYCWSQSQVPLALVRNISTHIQLIGRFIEEKFQNQLAQET